MGRFLVLALVAGCADSASSGGVCAISESPPEVVSAKPATTIYLNRSGGTIRAGADDALANTSSIVGNHQKTELVVPAAPFSDAQWSQVVSCVREAYARFDVEIVDQRPASGGYVMAMFGGDASGLGLGADTRGIAPLDKSSCSTIDNAVAFVFTATVANDVQKSCEIAAHEIAHTFGVDHALLAADLTSYLAFSGTRTFQDVDAQCGEDTARPCICGRETQNSVAILLDKLGPAQHGDREAPAISLALGVSPNPETQSIRVTARDDGKLGSVALTYRDDARSFTAVCGDGTMPCRTFNGISTFTLPAAVGHAVMHAEAVDLAGNAAATQPLELGAAPAIASTIALRADGLSAHLSVISDAVEVSAFWTTADGVTIRRALCDSDGEWTLDVELAAAGERSVTIQLVDAAGHSRLEHPRL